MLSITFITAHANSDVLFIGHGYGNHGEGTIPYAPLEALMNKNKLPDTRIWGGDLTEHSTRFPEFRDYLEKIGGVNLLIRGNHDGSLYTKTPYWSNYVTSENIWVHNFDLEPNMEFKELPIRPNIIASHYVWFNQLYSPLNLPNSMYGAEFIDLKKIELDNNAHLFIAGDCGAFSWSSGGFARTYIGKNQFVCSGVGGGVGVNNVVVIDARGRTTPLFFSNDGSIISHVCKTIKSNSEFGNKIEVCGTSEYMSKNYH